MVAPKLSNSRSSDSPNLRSVRYIRNRKAETREAAIAAGRLCEQICGGELAKAPDESVLFAALQSCAFRAVRQARRRSPRDAMAVKWCERWKTIRDYILEQNIGLVYSMIGRFGMKEVDRDDQRSEAFYALLHAVERFNPWRGIRFSTYACSAISHSLIHLSKKAARHRDRFPVEHEEWMEQSTDLEAWLELYADRLRRALQSNEGELTDREAAVLGWRFPLEGGRSLTFAEIGDAIGLSRERARQIQEKALGKLRGVLEADAALQ